MLFFKALLLFIFLCSARSDMENKCDNEYRYMNNSKIEDIDIYCKNKLCLTKCCGDGEILYARRCVTQDKLFTKCGAKCTHLKPLIDYSNISIYTTGDVLKTNIKVNFIKNYNINCTVEYPKEYIFHIIEDGSSKIKENEKSKWWVYMNKLEYCVDYRVIVTAKKQEVRLVLREIIAQEDGLDIFVAIGLAVSCFFLLLVFLVYCFLPKLRNIIGMVLMAYVGTLFITYLIKTFTLLGNKYTSTKLCKIITPFFYFTATSIFFWLNVMSFDVWWTLRGHRKCRDIHRRGEMVKFMWYSVYAWGGPLIITIIVVIIDNVNIDNWPSIAKPHFDECFTNTQSVQMYFYKPIAVLIAINIILFFTTAYNIWMIRSRVQSSEDSRKSKQETTRFITYIKLSVIMGVSWFLEVIPREYLIYSWLDVLVNIYNLLIGVAIFFLFVFKYKILFMLCVRFNIQNKFITRREWYERHSRSGTTKSTRTSTSRSRRGNEQDSMVSQV